MAKYTLSRNSRSFQTWQLFVCLLLTALVVYNPYLAGAESGPGLCLRHSASNRATVGASELQHFAPAQKSASLLPGDALLLFALLTPTLHPSGQRTTTGSVRPAAVQHLAPSLWFRPPPSLQR
jgi:hypothetical protein